MGGVLSSLTLPKTKDLRFLILESSEMKVGKTVLGGTSHTPEGELSRVLC